MKALNKINIYFLFNIIMTFINLLIEYKLYPQDESELDESEDKYYLPLQMINYLYTYIYQIFWQ